MLLEPLKRLDYTPFLILGESAGELLSDAPADVEIISLGRKRAHQALLPLAKVLRDRPPAVLISSLERNNMVALAARALAVPQMPVILRQDNVLLPLRKTTALFYCRMLPLADAIVAVSKGVEDDLIARCPGRMLFTKVIYNPVIRPNLRALAMSTGEGNPILGSGGLPFFVGAGRLTPQKDFSTLIRAFALCRKTKDVRLVLLGDGPQRGELEALCRTLGIAGEVDFLGFRPNPFPYMAKAAAFILSSAYEGFGNVVAEALALGTPVISTDCRHGPAEILDHGRYGQLVPVADAGEMAKAMIRALDGPARIDVPVEWLVQFTPDFAAEHYAALIEQTLSRRQPGHNG